MCSDVRFFFFFFFFFFILRLIYFRIAVSEFQHAQLLMESAQAQYYMQLLPVELSVFGGLYCGTAAMKMFTV